MSHSSKSFYDSSLIAKYRNCNLIRKFSHDFWVIWFLRKYIVFQKGTWHIPPGSSHDFRVRKGRYLENTCLPYSNILAICQRCSKKSASDILNLSIRVLYWVAVEDWSISQIGAWSIMSVESDPSSRCWTLPNAHTMQASSLSVDSWLLSKSLVFCDI